MSFTYEYPRPSVCVDIIVLHKKENKTFILLIERKHPPFENYWALPGGFVEMNETLEQSALRELHEETGIKLKELKQFATYGDPGRDPRGRTVSIIYYTFIEKQISTLAGDDAAKAKWIDINEIPILAFDHNLILEDFKKLNYSDYFS